MGALKYIFAVLLIAAVWAVVLLLGMPMWIAIVATVVIIAILAAFVIIKIVRAKKAAKEIEKALRAQADRHAASARPDLRGDIDSMQQEFLKAIAALKSSKLAGKKPSEALYALPWYMIIGPPGSGKSTALRQSGLRFPYQSKSGGGVQGVGGTRNCQWWMTNEAVILDTAGRYTTEDSDRDEWMSFLDLLKKNRPKQPVNGVLVAIAVTDVSEAHPEEVHARAREVRARIDEVMAKLEMVVPVYVLFTKVDLLPGFVELFSDLGNTERRQIWGFTVPVTQKHDPAQTFIANFDELSQTVERRAIRRMGEERGADGRDKIYQFPQYFEPMRDKLAAFVGELMADNVYAESPHLRGVYFTSGTQEGRTIDRIMNSMAAAFGVQPKLAYTTPQIEPKSYFLGELFEKVIFPDKNIAQRSAAKIKKQALVGHAIGGGLMLAAIGMALLPVLSFRNNRELLTNTQDAIGKVEEHVAAKTNAPIRLNQIDPLRAVERELNEHEVDGAPFMMRMGMYQGSIFAAQIRTLYLRTVRDELIKPFLDLTVEELRSFVNKHGPSPDAVDPDTHRDYEAKLRMYLLLTAVAKGGGELDYPPKGEPGLDEKQRGWLRVRIAELWRDALKHLGDVAASDTMLNVADAYIDIVATDKLYLFERDPKLVEGARKILKRTDQIESLLNELVRDVEAPDITLAEISGSRKALLNDNTNVPGKYTRRAWEGTGGIADKLASPSGDLLGNEWVLGWTEEEVAATRQRQQDLLRSKYFTEYISAWRKFVGNAYTKSPTDLADAHELLKDLTGGTPPPIMSMCQHVGYNTTLEDPDPVIPEEVEDGLAEKALEAGEKAAAKKMGGKNADKLAAAKKALLEEKRKKRAADPTLKINEDVKKEFADFIKFACGEVPVVPEGEPRPPQAAVALDNYQTELKNVRDAVQAKINEDTPENIAALKKAVDVALAATDSLILEADNGNWVAGSLKKILPPPLRGLQQVANASAEGALTRTYCVEVVEPMTKMLERYPFKGEGAEVSHQQVAEFFAPDGGKLWDFHAKVLSSRVPEKNNTFSLAKAGASARPIDPRLVQFLNRARDLQRALFSAGGKEMVVEFDVMIRPLAAASATILNIDGHEITYRNEPERWEKYVWPGEGDKKLGTILVKGAGFTDNFGQDSKWGIFRLLEEGTIADGGTGAGFNARYNLSASIGVSNKDSAVLQIRFKPQEPDINPFFGNSDRPVTFMGVFRHPDLVPPKSVYIGGVQCE